MNVRVPLAKSQTSRHTSLATISESVRLVSCPLGLSVSVCGLSEAGSLIATEWRDYAQRSTNERGGAGKARVKD